MLGSGYDDISAAERQAVLAAYPRVDFKESIIQALADGLAHRPETAFGNVKADVLAEKLPVTSAQASASSYGRRSSATRAELLGSGSRVIATSDRLGGAAAVPLLEAWPLS